MNKNLKISSREEIILNGKRHRLLDYSNKKMYSIQYVFISAFVYDISYLKRGTIFYNCPL